VASVTITTQRFAAHSNQRIRHGHRLPPKGNDRLCASGPANALSLRPVSAGVEFTELFGVERQRFSISAIATHPPLPASSCSSRRTNAGGPQASAAGGSQAHVAMRDQVCFVATAVIHDQRDEKTTRIARSDWQFRCLRPSSESQARLIGADQPKSRGSPRSGWTNCCGRFPCGQRRRRSFGVWPDCDAGDNTRPAVATNRSIA